MLHSLRLQDFRCFATLDIEVPPQGALLVGQNAQGKTSILEAICMLVRLHSPRTHKIAAMARLGTGRFGIAGDPWNDDRKVRLNDGSLQLEVNGEIRPSQSSYLTDGGLVVWMGNEDLELVRGPGEVRRRYLDFLGAQLDPRYRRAWSRYKRALRAKNLLLKQPKPNRAEIESYEAILIEHGSVLMEIRAALVEGLAPLAAEAQRAVSGRDEPLDLKYLPGSGPDLAESMAQVREREMRLRQSVIGPHRDDLELRLHGLAAGEFASEGQQRTLALALKLAQGRLLESRGGRTPIYLLDDIFGELDPARRNALMRFLPSHAQKWITTTHLDWLADHPDLPDLRRFHIEAGTAR